ncbi:MAG: hypothetical protein ACLRWF_11495 [Ruthenibacterium sp.]
MQNDSGLLLFENLRPGAPRVDLREMSPLALAFVGDGVYEVLVRRMLVEHTRLGPNLCTGTRCALSRQRGSAPR